MKTTLAFILFCAAGAGLAQTGGNLVVEVRMEEQSTQQTQGAGLGIHRHGGVIHGNQRTVKSTANNIQRLLVMDGGTASLSSVQTQPIRMRQVLWSPHGKIVSDGYVFRSLGGGIVVRPRLQGERVVIEVSAEEARPVANQPLAADVVQLSTQISGRIGEWIMIGDDERNSSQQGDRIGLGGVGQGSSSESGSNRVWLRVMPQGQ